MAADRCGTLLARKHAISQGINDERNHMLMSSRLSHLRPIVGVGLVALLVVTALTGTASAQSLKKHATSYYTLHADMEKEKTLEVAARLTRMFEEYARRSKNFARPPRSKLNCYLYNTIADYERAGGPENSGGCFNRRKGLLIAADVSAPSLARIMQHEAFHQFAHHAISPEVPVWVNEGLADYFERAIWTGDGYVIGIVSSQDLKMIRKDIALGNQITFSVLIQMSRRRWNDILASSVEAGGRNYREAWSLVHFLAHAEDGKYLKALDRYLSNIHNHQTKRIQVFVDGVEGLGDNYETWWNTASLEDTYRREWEAVVATLTSFIGRAYIQNQHFESIDEFFEAIRTNELKLAASNTKQWLPVSLLDSALARMRRLSHFPDAANLKPLSWSLTFNNRRPQIVLTLKDGTTMTGTFKTQSSRISSVEVDIKLDAATGATDLSVFAMLAREGSPGEVADFVYLTVDSPTGGYYWWLVQSELAGDPIRTRDHGSLIVPMPDADDRRMVICPRTGLRISIPKSNAEGLIPTADEEGKFRPEAP